MNNNIFKHYKKCTLNSAYLTSQFSRDKVFQIYGEDKAGNTVLISRIVRWEAVVHDGAYCTLFGKRIPWEMIVAMDVPFTVVADDCDVIEAEVCGDDLPEDVQVTLMEGY